MKGILICGGTGSRLRPLTDITNKSLLPVYDKPLILYPLQILLDAGIRHIAVITGPEHMDQMTKFLGTGERFGCEFVFKVQEKPEGIAQALGLAEGFVDGDSCTVILGDNVYFDTLSPTIAAFKTGSHIFIKEVTDPERFGVVELKGKQVISLEEKPKKPRSNYALTGCYVFDKRCFEVVRNLKPSWRNELEITDVCHWFMEKGEIEATVLKEEWIDAGTFESLFKATELARKRKAGINSK